MLRRSSPLNTIWPMKKRPQTPSTATMPLHCMSEPINDEKDRFLLFHIRREQYANGPLCRLHQLRIFISICCQALYRLTSCGLLIPIEHRFRERFTSSKSNSKPVALALSLFSVSSVSGMTDHARPICLLYPSLVKRNHCPMSSCSKPANFSVVSVHCETYPLSHVIIQ